MDQVIIELFFLVFFCFSVSGPHLLAECLVILDRSKVLICVSGKKNSFSNDSDRLKATFSFK